MNKNYELHTEEMLVKSFPYMFNQENIGFSFYRGWMPIIAGACIDIDQLLGGDRERFHWTQLKEKFGTGRFHFALDGDSEVRGDIYLQEVVWSFSTPKSGDGAPSTLRRTISALVRAAEEESARNCMICGEPARPQSYWGNFMNLCSDHHPLKLQRPGEGRWEAVRRLMEPGVPGGNGL